MRLVKSAYTSTSELKDSNQPWDESGESCVGLFYCLNALRHNLGCHTVTLLSRHHYAIQLHQLIFLQELENDSFVTFFRTTHCCLICKARALYLGRWSPLLGTCALYSSALKLSVRASVIVSQVNSRGRGRGGGVSRDGILGHQVDKRLECFAPPSTGGFLQKTIPYSVSKNPNKNPRNKKSRVSS
jgi:hypothetical protein